MHRLVSHQSSRPAESGTASAVRCLAAERAAASAAARSAPSCGVRGWVAAAGSTRTTTSVPGASGSVAARTRWRRRRRTRLRITAVTHGLGHDETRPGQRRGAGARRRSVVAGQRGARPGRRGRPAGHAGWRRRSRRCAAVAGLPRASVSPVSVVRPRGDRAPWRGASRGWRGRPGCACAAGSRGSSRAGGCSAGTCACSLSTPSVQSPDRGGHPDRPVSGDEHTPIPPTPHAAPLGAACLTRQGYSVRSGRLKPRPRVGAVSRYARIRMAGQRLSGCGQRC